MANNPRPIEAYPSEYLEFLKRAAIERTPITLENWRTAFKVRVQIQSLRSRMKRDHHPLYEAVAKTTLLIRTTDDLPIIPNGRIAGSGAVRSGVHARFPDGTTRLVPDNEAVLLVGEPRDSGVLGAFHAAGIQAEELEADPLAAFKGDL